MTSSFPGDFTTVTNISGEFVDNDIDTISIDTDSGSNSGTQTSGEIASGTTTTISATDTLSAESDSSWVDGVDTITISLGGNPITFSLPKPTLPHRAVGCSKRNKASYISTSWEMEQAYFQS